MVVIAMFAQEQCCGKQRPKQYSHCTKLGALFCTLVEHDKF